MSVLVYDVMRMAKENHSPICLRYLNSSYKIQSTCAKCLSKVHFRRKNNGYVRDYDCKNMIYYYCGRYSLKHAGEIFLLLQRLSHRVPQEPKILSIGCGPCTDLFAYEIFYRKLDSKRKIKYYGVERNLLWSNIHSFITQNRRKYNLSEFKVDYFDVIEKFSRLEQIIEKEKPNIISFQYVLSDMTKYHDVEFVKRFTEKLIKRAFEILPESTMIIFNDTNVIQSYADRNPDEIKGRYILEHLASVFWSSRKIGVFKYYFPYREDPSLVFGAAHSELWFSIESVPEDLRTYFDMWTEYRSAQLVLIKNQSNF